MQRNPQLLISFVSITVALALAFAFTRPSREPAYNGKSLTEWLRDRQFTEGGQDGLSETSVRAVRAIGTNALPHLLGMLRSSDSQWKMKLADAFERFPLLRDWYPTSEERRVRAICGFRALGAAAKPAFPKLVNLVLSSDDNSDAINALTEADQGAITLLVKGLSDADPKVRVRAAFALGCLRQASSVSIPALIIALNDPDPEVRARAAGSLGPYGPQAKPALPELARLSRDESQRISYAAKEALRLIDSASQARQ